MPSDLACWVDLETTGGDHLTGHVLEVAAVITTADPAAEVLAEFERVVAPAMIVAELAAGVPFSALVNPEVAAMHERNGLARALRTAAPTSTRSLDADLTAWRLEVCDRAGAPRKMLLAGSGVAHFETRWLPRHFPRFNGGLTYYALDTGVLRRALRLCGVDVPPNGSRTHRALADVHDHIAEWRAMSALVAAPT